MAISFENRVAIITGAGGGLGRTYALDIAKRGGAVVVNDLGCAVDGSGSSRGPADKVVAEIKATGGRAVASYETVVTRDGARRIVQTALDSFGRIDALINNAGNLRNDWFEDVKEEDRDALIATHLLGTFNVAQAVWPHMQAQKYGRIVFTSSASGMLGNPMQVGYGMAKAGVTGLMTVLSQEGKAHGILCNALMPNALTRMGEKHAEKMKPGDLEKMAPIMAAIGKSMDPSFTTAITVYLASEACTSTHSIYSHLGGRFARVIIGVTEGWQGSRETPSTVDDIARHIDQIRDTTRAIHVPDELNHEFRIVVKTE
jgi:NAD(P)-dependent dehydrogenase (short-subunit alcohol dehydrogenase family)